MQDEIEYYKNFDVSHAKEVTPTFIQKLHQRKHQVEAIGLDSDVLNWLATTDQTTKQRINDMIRKEMLADHA